VLSSVVMCSHMWSSALTCGHVLSHVVTCSHLWSCALTCGHVLSSVVMCSHLWSSTLTCSHVLSPVVMFSHLWSCSLICGHVLSSVVMCSHLWSSGQEQVNLDACVTEALARSGNTINYDPDLLHCNVKRCNPTTGELHYNDVMYDVNVNGDDVTEFNYRLTDSRGGWDVYAIICK